MVEASLCLALTPEVVEKLNKKWKGYGTVWEGVVESETMTFRIPEEPLTRNCMTPSSSLPRQPCRRLARLSASLQITQGLAANES
jgi:hypothetical protein